MRVLVVIGVVLGLCISVGTAEESAPREGILQPIALDVSDSQFPGRHYFTAFRKSPDDSGTVHPGAVVAEERVPGNGMRFCVAIDANSPDANAPNVLRLSLDGEAQFANAAVIPLKELRKNPDGSFQAEFGPAKVELKINGRTQPIMVSGRYYKQGRRRFLQMNTGWALRGRCRFGKTLYLVRLQDANSNGTVTDSPDMAVLQPLKDDGSPDGAPQTVFCRQPIRIGDAWYSLQADIDTLTLATKKLDIQSGILKGPAVPWEAKLFDGNAFVQIFSAGGEAVVPTGRWEIQEYRLHNKPGKEEPRKGPVAVRYNRRGPNLLVNKDSTIQADFGPPLRTSLKIMHRARSVTFHFQLADATGKAIFASYFRGGTYVYPAPPEVVVMDDTGKEVHRGRMEYG